MAADKFLTIYLSGWQKRMVLDHVKLPKTITKIKLGKIPTKEWVMYRVPIFEDIKQGAWLLYLTDEQIPHLAENLGVKAKVSALTITPAMIESKAVVFE